MTLNSFSAAGPIRRMRERRALRRASEVPMRFNALGTLANPGDATPLAPTIPMQIGAALNPLLERVTDVFPAVNPYGTALERIIVGDSPERTGLVAEGYPDQYFHFNRGSRSNVSPQIVDLAAALPIGSAATLAKAAIPAVKAAIPVAKAAAVPAAMYAASRIAEPLLGISASTKIPNDFVGNVAEGLLGARLAGDPNMSVSVAAPTEGLLAATEPQRFADPDAMGFRSVVSDVIDLDSFPSRGTAEQMEAALGQKGGLSNQVRSQIGNRRIDKEELKFLGITDLLDEAKRRGQPLTRQQLQNHIRFYREKLHLNEEELIDLGESESWLQQEVLGFREAESQDYIDERIDEELRDNDYFAEWLADRPDLNEEIRQEAFELLENQYDDDPLKRIRLMTSEGDGYTDIYAIGRDGEGWTIRKGGDSWDESETLTTRGNFINLRHPAANQEGTLLLNTHHEAGVRLEDLAREDLGASGAAQFREYVVEDGPMGDIGEVTNYREVVVRLPEAAGGNIGSHFGDDVAYHMRVSDRDYFPGMTRSDQSISNSTRENALFVDEIQSDYAQAGAGRKLPLSEFDKAILNELGIDKKELNLALSNFDTNEAIQASNNLLMQLSNIKRPISLSDKELIKHGNASYSEQLTRLQRKLTKEGDSRVKEQPLVGGKEKWVQHAIKNLITRMVNENQDRIIFTSGKNQAEHWGEEGLEYFYDTKVRKEIADVLKGIDKDAVEVVDGGFSSKPGDAGTRKHISIRNTQKIKDFIYGVGDKPKGFGIYSAAPVAVGVGGLLNADNNAGN